MAASLSLAVWAAIGSDAAITVSLIQLGLLIFTALKLLGNGSAAHGPVANKFVF